MKRANPASVKSTAGRRRVKDVPLRRQRAALGERDVERGMKDTERRGTPSDVPSGRR
jgi:hypothetical protein